MTEISIAEVDQTTAKPINSVGRNFMLHADTMARATEHGYANPFAFYFAGRGGVLGDVDAEVVYAAFGWFTPAVVRSMWDEGVAVHGAAGAAERYFDACAAWGRDHLGGVDGLDRFADLAGRVVDSAETSGRSLFAGWKVQPRAADAPGQAMQLVHVLREWRGSNHLVATTACGLAPLEALLCASGEPHARFFGWTAPFPDMGEEQMERLREAEELTGALCRPAFEVLSAGERAEFVDLVAAIATAGRREEVPTGEGVRRLRA